MIPLVAEIAAGLFVLREMALRRELTEPGKSFSSHFLSGEIIGMMTNTWERSVKVA